MYRSGLDYDEMAKLAIQIYIDHNIRTFPIDEFEVCRKLGVNLIPYSRYSESERKFFISRSSSGFYIPPTGEKPPMIFYNDSVNEVRTKGIIRRNIFHEVKHYVAGDTDEHQPKDDLADYFAKYFLAPIPYLIANQITDTEQIISNFGVDTEIAGYIEQNLYDRSKKYGSKIFDYEKPLIEHLMN